LYRAVVRDQVRIALADEGPDLGMAGADMFIEWMKIGNTLRWLGSETLMAHFGLEYYD